MSIFSHRSGVANAQPKKTSTSPRRALIAYICVSMLVFTIDFVTANNANAQTAETCIEDGGNALCTAPETGKWRWDGYWLIPTTSATGWVLLTEEDAKAHLMSSSFDPYCYIRAGSVALTTGYAPISQTSGGLIPPIAGIYPRFDAHAILGFSRDPKPECSNQTQASFEWNGWIGKIRDVQCPRGYSLASNNNYCFKPQVDSCSPLVNNPVSPSLGAKFQSETDYSGAGEFGLAFKRTYNSFGFYRPAYTASDAVGPLGDYWQHNYSGRIYLPSMGTRVMAIAQRPDSTLKHFGNDGLELNNAGNYGAKLSRELDGTGAQIGWRYAAPDGSVELYNNVGALLSITARTGITQTMTYSDAATPTNIAPKSGLLIRVTDSFSRQFNFTYDSSSRISTMTDPMGQNYGYGYDANSNLIVSTYPDSTPAITVDNPTRRYLYNEPALNSGTNLIHALTGITDENGVRFASYGYDGTGRAISTEHAGGAQKATLFYASSAQTTVFDYKDSETTANSNRIYSFQTVAGVIKNTGTSLPCASGCGTSSAATTYDTNGNVASRTDFNGNKTTFGYDLTRNLETQRIEALTSASATTPQTRTITTEWHANWRLPKRMAEPKRITSYAYNGDGGLYCAPTTALVNGIPIGVLCSKTVTETTDANGSLGFSATASVPANVRAWAYTYNSLGQMFTSNGPRTDITDVTTPLCQTSCRL